MYQNMPFSGGFGGMPQQFVPNYPTYVDAFGRSPGLSHTTAPWQSPWAIAELARRQQIEAIARQQAFEAFCRNMPF